MFKKLLLIVVLGFILTGTQLPAAYACSGFPHFGVDDLPTMDLLVRATVIDTDDAGYNAILRVEDYYKGEGAQFITVMRYPAALQTGAYIRGYDTGCLYAGYGRRWVQGSQGYFGLNPNSDGTFTDYNGGTAHFYPVDGKIFYQEGATDGYALEFDEPLSISEANFIGLMLQAGERDEPLAPTTEPTSFYPLMRFLTITTESGTRYQVNPDRSVKQLPDGAPIAVSPDGAHLAFRVDDETIAFQYIWTTYRHANTEITDENEATIRQFQRPGKAVSFSNDSSFVAVWDETQLTIYMLGNTGESAYHGYGTGMDIHEVAQVDVTMTDDSVLPQVLWSADGSTLVWQDSEGIWRWNIFDDAEPMLVLEVDADMLAEATQTLLDVSTYGRYVRVQRPDDWILIDSQTQETYIDAIVSPNEQFVIYTRYQPRYTDNDTESQPRCTPPLRTTCSTVLYDTEGITSFFDMPVNLLGFVICGTADEPCIASSRSWHPAIGRTGYFNRVGTQITDLRQVTYDVQYNQPALVVGDYQIYFWFYSDYVTENEDYHPYLDWLNLEDVLDSPIQHIEWGQAVFYEDYMVTTMQYRPR